VFACLSSACTAAITGTYVDATASNTSAANLTWSSDSDSSTDKYWYGLTYSGTQGNTVWQAYNKEDVPKITTVISGLNASKKYRIYVIYYGKASDNRQVYAGLAGTRLQNYGITDGTAIGYEVSGVSGRQVCVGTVEGMTWVGVDIDSAGIKSADVNSSYTTAVYAWYDGVAYEEVSSIGKDVIYQRYVDAGPSNTSAVVGGNWYATPSNTIDNLWSLRSYAGPQGDNIFEAHATENTKTLRTAVNGLDPLTKYNIYLVHCTKDVSGARWRTLAAMSGDTLQLRDLDTGQFTGWYSSGLCSQRVLLGSVIGQTSIAIDVNDQLHPPVDDNRTWYDGVLVEADYAGYEPVITGCYVDATTSNTVAAGGGNWWALVGGSDNLWYLRSYGTYGKTVFQADAPENPPKLTTTITGLDKNKTYNVYVIFHGKKDASSDWQIQAALSGQTLATYNNDSGYATDYYSSGIYGRQVWLATVSDVNSVAVDIDDGVDGSLDKRTWYDGLAFEEVRKPCDSSTAPVLYYYDITYAGAYGKTARYDERHVVSCIQGLVNRNAPRLFVRYFGGTGDHGWLNRLLEPGGLCENWKVQEISNVESLISTFSAYISGVILYDPDPNTGAISTSLVATSVAGAENAIAVRKDTTAGSMYNYLVNDADGPHLTVLVDLAGKFTGTGTIWQTSTASTGSKKCDAYVWLKQKYIDTSKCNPEYLSYTMDLWGLKLGGNDMTQLCNLDYAVSKKAVCFELSPWGDEVPNDDTGQPLGTDLNTFKMLLDACNTKTNKQTMIQMSGFPNWPYKYSTSVGGSHSPVALEWEFMRFLTAYNVYTDVEFYLSNTSFYSALAPATNERRYVQNPAPTYDDMVAAGLINAGGSVVAGNYVMIGMGDYDCSAWTMQRLANSTGVYSNAGRGQVYCNWGVNPTMINKASVAMDYMYRGKTGADCFISWDSGAGYINPTQLYGTRSPSGYPSGLSLWQAHCRKYYRMMDYSISGWLLNGAVDLSSTDCLNYASFSGDGIGIHISSSGTMYLVDNKVPVNLIKGSSDTTQFSMMDYASGVNFGWYRAVNWNTGTQESPVYAAWGPDHIKLVMEQKAGSGHNHRFLDAYSYYYLMRYYLSGNNNYRATWINDTAPKIMQAGRTYPITVTVRNDGWDTWNESNSYRLGYSLVLSGSSPNYGRQYLPSLVSVLPGQTWTFTFNITAPSTYGIYDFQLDMVKEGATWFASQNNIEWKSQITVAANETDIDTDGDGIPDVIETSQGTLYWHPDSVIYKKSDFNHDGRVNYKDLMVLAENWLRSASLTDIAPTIPDGATDFMDFSVFAEDWLE